MCIELAHEENSCEGSSMPVLGSSSYEKVRKDLFRYYLYYFKAHRWGFISFVFGFSWSNRDWLLLQTAAIGVF